MKAETRKLQLTGGSTYIVSLPKTWVSQRGLQAGDPVSIQLLEDGRLLVGPTVPLTGRETRRTVMVEEGPPEHLARTLIGLFLAGPSTLELRAKSRFSPELRQTIRVVTNKIIGPEIIEETANRMVIQDLLDPTYLPMEKSLRRMASVAASMARDALVALERRDAQLAKDIALRDDEVDRLYWLVSRQCNLLLRDPALSGQMNITPAQCLNFRSVGKVIERIGDHAQRIAENAIQPGTEDLPAELVTRTMEYGKLALDAFDRSMDAFYRRSLDLANEAIDSRQELVALKKDLLHSVLELKGKRAVPLAYILESLERIGFYSTDIAEVAINYAALEGSR